MGVCFMFGNRSIPVSAEGDIAAAVERAIAGGMEEFIVGRRGGFDAAAAVVLRRAKEVCPKIRLYMLLSYHPEGKIILPDGFNGTIYPPGMEKVPARFAIVRANQWAVENSGHVIAYVRYTAGNSGKLLDYARKKGVSIDNIV